MGLKTTSQETCNLLSLRVCGLCPLLTLWPYLNPLLRWLHTLTATSFQGKFIERNEHWTAREQDPLEGIRCHNKMTFFCSQSLMPRTVCTLSVRNQQRRLGNTMYLCSKKIILFSFRQICLFPSLLINLSLGKCLEVISQTRVFPQRTKELKN